MHLVTEYNADQNMFCIYWAEVFKAGNPGLVRDLNSDLKA